MDKTRGKWKLFYLFADDYTYIYIYICMYDVSIIYIFIYLLFIPNLAATDQIKTWDPRSN